MHTSAVYVGHVKDYFNGLHARIRYELLHVQVHAELSAGVYGPLLVVPRPGLSEFLSRASRVAELVVFTAAAPGEPPLRPCIADVSDFRRH